MFAAASARCSAQPIPLRQHRTGLRRFGKLGNCQLLMRDQYHEQRLPTTVALPGRNNLSCAIENSIIEELARRDRRRSSPQRPRLSITRTVRTRIEFRANEQDKTPRIIPSALLSHGGIIPQLNARVDLDKFSGTTGRRERANKRSTVKVDERDEER